ncbi:glycosyltransferase family 4 protein [Telluribacter humicola]|uniref:glycosyltransferase family 4 protein n=1 Tax=Telluribacter humicola TaxID=1720261 RepID=UPI001A96DB62|nr:glycosyltransferase family 4 protein [Telluribacter humicola]
MATRLLVFDTHPVQYRVPVWQEIEAVSPGTVHVVYASDCSVRGHLDTGFNKTIAWDEPLLDGYQSTILNCERGTPFEGWGSLTGDGVEQVFETVRPDNILLTGFNYKYDLVAFWHAYKRNIPVYLRCETQDQATNRSKFKQLVRHQLYSFLYKYVDTFFYIGQLNKQHYLDHGVQEHKLKPAHYFTIDRFKSLSVSQKISLRNEYRERAGIPEDALVVGFSGKFIPKKNPDILFEIIEHMPAELASKVHFYFLGSGELEESLKQKAGELSNKYGVKTFFAGFSNQSQLPGHYLSMDILVLPSRRMGETWGLVTNEAMQAGCSVVVSSAVGCKEDFRSLERFRIFEEASSSDLASQIISLSYYPRSFDWAANSLEKYSVDFTANAIIETLNKKQDLVTV